MKLISFFLAALPFVASLNLPHNTFDQTTPDNVSSDLATISNSPHANSCIPKSFSCSDYRDKTSWVIICMPDGRWKDLMYCGKTGCCKKMDGGRATCTCRGIEQDGGEGINLGSDLVPVSTSTSAPASTESHHASPLMIVEKDQCSSTCTSALQSCKKMTHCQMRQCRENICLSSKWQCDLNVCESWCALNTPPRDTCNEMPRCTPPGFNNFDDCLNTCGPRYPPCFDFCTCKTGVWPPSTRTTLAMTSSTTLNTSTTVYPSSIAG